VDKAVKKKNAELLTDKDKDDWNENEDSHVAVAHSGASASVVAQPFNNTDLSQPKRLPALARGEPSRDSHQPSLAATEEDSLGGW